MKPRLVVLLFLAVASGVTASLVGSATAGKTRVAATIAPRAVTFGPCPIPARFHAAFVRAAHETRLPLELLAAVARVESEFSPNARSVAGAHGLFQILPSTAEALKLDVSTPEKNVSAGAHYLRLLLNQFQSTELMLAAYNAGPTAVEKAGGIPNNESLKYVSEVTGLWKSLRGCT